MNKDSIFYRLARRAAKRGVIPAGAAENEFATACMIHHKRGRLDAANLETAPDSTFEHTAGIIYGYCEVIDHTPACAHLSEA